jgi:3-oxoacyl-(acyl-carrier-protein) synthase
MTEIKISSKRASVVPYEQRKPLYAAYRAAHEEAERIGETCSDDRIILAATKAYEAALVASGWRREAPTCQENAEPIRLGVFVDTHLHECAREQGHRSAVHRCACNTEWWEAEQYVSADTREGEDQKRDEEQQGA